MNSNHCWKVYEKNDFYHNWDTFFCILLKFNILVIILMQKYPLL